MNAATNYPDIAPRADATKVTDWASIFDLEELHRFSYGTQSGANWCA